MKITFYLKKEKILSFTEPLIIRKLEQPSTKKTIVRQFWDEDL